MKISTRTRYGMRALMDLALHNSGQSVQLKDVAARQKISLSYLEHLMIPLISAGLVKSSRGARGGVRLAKEPEQITLKEIMDALEGPFYPVDCLKVAGHCQRSGACATQDIWKDIKTAMEGVLISRNLQELAERQKTKESDKQEIYYI